MYVHKSSDNPSGCNLIPMYSFTTTIPAVSDYRQFIIVFSFGVCPGLTIPRTGISERKTGSSTVAAGTFGQIRSAEKRLSGTESYSSSLLKATRAISLLDPLLVSAFASSANERKVLRTNLPTDYHLMQRTSLSFSHRVAGRYLEQA
jgi:hypothetical protein